ncbi:hypothetical protein IQ249_06420 [Lusitaniella coriacea LEGE 07157]|uniref:Uncharacterized protein n=1 Tax=Lusitaniella coriacea LEGE 07157 TaxID=945747 RepID=A0A8J7J9F9_9CYAN|nr:hypothetical protein [Lusitaniella coriacea]MBE9115530.1 hypothetical protein [Lusitaniella coriacea LEGE 07157]
MDSHLFRKGRWVIDLSDNDVHRHLQEDGLSQDTFLILKYFLHLLFIDTRKLGINEFSDRNSEIKDAVLNVMQQKYDSAARTLSAVIEGIVTKTLINDGCLVEQKCYPTWTGRFHDHPEPKNFHQLLEGALRDPRSRIGRTIDYPPSEEIFHVSEMIRNPLAHGTMSVGTFEDYKVLFFLLILLYHDIVNPHNYEGNHKYLKWAERMRVNLRLRGMTPTNSELEALASKEGLDLIELRKNL